MKLKSDETFTEEDLKHFKRISLKIPEEFFEIIETKEVNIDDFNFVEMCGEFATRFYYKEIFFRLYEEDCYFNEEFYINLNKYNLENEEGVGYYDRVVEIIL